MNDFSSLVPVCVVDDDAGDRDTAEKILTEAGYGVKVFSSGADFIASLETIKPACVLVDIRMPRINGTELLQMVTKRQPSLPVIMISGKADVQEALKTISHGAVDFLQKPLDADSLVLAVQDAIAREPERVGAKPELVGSNDVLAKISPRELEVLKLLLGGESNKSIAYTLGISPRTVEVHRANMMKRLDVSSFAELVRVALEAGILPE